MAKKLKKSKVHVTYNQKSFLAPNSILSMAAIHTKIKPDGTAIVRISDCNNCVRIWNDLNTKEGKIEMVEKVDMLINQLVHFREDVMSRFSNEILLHQQSLFPNRKQITSYE